MRDVDKGFLRAPLNLLELDLHILSELEVERAERFVQQNDIGVADESARDGDTLLLTARQLLYGTLFITLEVNNSKHLADLFLYFILGELFELQAKGDIVKYVKMGEQRIFLKHRIDVSLVGRKSVDTRSVKNHIAALRLDKASDNTQCRGFSAAAGTQNRYKFFFMDVEINMVQYNLAVEPHKNIL